MRKGLIAQGDPREVIADEHARYYGAPVGERTLLPGQDARLGEITFDVARRPVAPPVTPGIRAAPRVISGARPNGPEGRRMRIIGPPSAAADTVRANLAAHFSPHARFAADMFPALWKAGERYSVDPVGVVAQSYKETAGGNFTGAVKPQFYNTCGLKIRHLGVLPEASGDLPLAHSMFASWEVGAEAHVQHLRAYAGRPVEGALIVDPRYWLVSGSRLENWADLGTRWAPSPTYGKEIESIMTRLGSP